MLKKSHILFLSVSFFLISCGEEKKEEVLDEEVTTDTLSIDTKASLGGIRVSIPSPLEVTAEIANAGFNYDKGVLNPSSKASSYSTNAQKALNLGVYGADLGYITVYNQSQDLLEYLKQISKLASDLGISSAFDEDMVKGLSANLGNSDSISYYINNAYDKAERNLRSNQRVSTTALLVAGGWVEGLYIATKVIGDKPKDEKNAALYERVWNHIYAFNYVFTLLDEYKDNPDCKKVSEDLKPTQQALVGYEKKGKLSNTDMKAIYDVIVIARNKIVG